MGARVGGFRKPQQVRLAHHTHQSAPGVNHGEHRQPPLREQPRRGLDRGVGSHRDRRARHDLFDQHCCPFTTRRHAARSVPASTNSSEPGRDQRPGTWCHLGTLHRSRVPRGVPGKSSKVPLRAAARSARLTRPPLARDGSTPWPSSTTTTQTDSSSTVTLTSTPAAPDYLDALASPSRTTASTSDTNAGPSPSNGPTVFRRGAKPRCWVKEAVSALSRSDISSDRTGR